MAEYILNWDDYKATARQVVAEGCVLLKNDKDTLPLKKNSKVSIFGRIQNDYYKSGTGSGGMVNVSHVVTIPKGLRNSGHVIINEELAAIYEKWEETHPFFEGEGWGNEPWSQEEMELTDDVVAAASQKSDTAIVIIGRTAGEDRDASNEPDSYRLNALEENMLYLVRKHFEKMAVLLNVGSIMDMSFIDTYNPDAVMYVWQGGMIGGDGTSDVLIGKVNPCGKLPDTIAYDISDYPATKNFGAPDRNVYEEDIYVGYRYFETFKPDAVRYPFGYGLSYTKFKLSKVTVDNDSHNQRITVNATVKNIGNVAGKQVVQIYIGQSQGFLGKAKEVLVGFKKTEVIAPNQEERIAITFSYSDFASFDDLGITGFKSSFVLEEGMYVVYAGFDAKDNEIYGEFIIPETIAVEKLKSALAPVIDINRIKPVIDDDGNVSIGNELVPATGYDEIDRRLLNMPDEIVSDNNQECDVADNKGCVAGNCSKEFSFSEVYEGRKDVSDFVANMSVDELICIVRGEGMGSSLVTPGTASAFAGVTPHLRSLQVPAVCCDDGPSGMRLDSGVKAFALPNGTMISSTFNPALVTKLYEFTSLEMISNRVDCLLGPGMNIHRHPLNGRNFEYFSEDPLVTGVFAGAMLDGLNKYGVTGTVKHFCGNNQEYRRRYIDSVISERALREIYLKGFEMVVRSKKATSVMTTYGSVNGLFTAGSYDLTTEILRNQWGFEGIVMTDWWADVSERDKAKCDNNFAQMVRAQNDIYMVCADSTKNTNDDNLLSEYEAGNLKKAELQRCAKNILSFAVKTQAMKRVMGCADKVLIVGKEEDELQLDLDNVKFLELEDELFMDLTDQECRQGSNIVIPLDAKNLGCYEVTVTASSELSEIAQIPCTIYVTGIPVATFTFNGSSGKPVSVMRPMRCYSRFCVCRLNIAKNGLKLISIKFKRNDELAVEKLF